MQMCCRHFIEPCLHEIVLPTISSNPDKGNDAHGVRLHEI